MDVPIAKLRRCPIQYRTVLKDTLDYVSLRDSIRDLGILIPLLVRPVEDYYEVIEGNHRHEIALDLGFQAVPCHIREMTDGQVRLAQVAAHENRIEPKPAEVYRRLWKIVHLDKVMTVKELAAHLRWHPKKVERTLRLTNLCLRAQKDLERDDLSLKVAEELCKLPVGRQETLMDLVGRMPEQEFIEELRKETRKHRIRDHDGRTQQEYRMRPIKEVTNEYLKPTEAASVLAATGATTLLEAFNAGVGWSIKADPASQAEDKRRNELKAAKEAARYQQRIKHSLKEKLNE